MVKNVKCLNNRGRSGLVWGYSAYDESAMMIDFIGEGKFDAIARYKSL